MLFAALAASLILQDQPTTELIEPDAADAVDAPQAELPPPTDAPTLTARIDGQWAAYGELAAQLAARQARERFLAELILPVIARSDLDDGAQGEILRETSDTVEAVETDNTGWARSQIDPESFVILYTEQQRLARQLLRLAERDEANEAPILAALEPVALAGLIEGPEFARRIDAFRVANDQPQRYGTADTCLNGQTNPGPIEDQATLDERRQALGLPIMAEAWTPERLAVSCEVTETAVEDAN